MIAIPLWKEMLMGEVSSGMMGDDLDRDDG
jgi:hypothetical protein